MWPAASDVVELHMVGRQNKVGPFAIGGLVRHLCGRLKSRRAPSDKSGPVRFLAATTSTLAGILDGALALAAGFSKSAEDVVDALLVVDGVDVHVLQLQLCFTLK